jgi:hypothetical protein
MNLFERVMIHSYCNVLKLYPRPFYQEYSEEMKSVFTESCHSMAQSSWALWKLGLREMVDLPFNLIREHWSQLTRGKMRTIIHSSGSFSPFIWRGVWGFGVAFGLVTLIFCVIDSMINSGRTLGQGITIWNFLIIHPIALGSGLGAAILTHPIGKRSAWRSVFVGFFGYMLSLLLWRFLISNPLQSLLPKGFYTLFSPTIMISIAGFVIGCGIGFIQRGLPGWGWYAFAGAFGFMVGWLLDRVIAAYILYLSPYGGWYIAQMVIGSPWYFLYWIVPMILFGMFIGVCLGLAMSRTTANLQTANI